VLLEHQAARSPSFAPRAGAETQIRRLLAQRLRDAESRVLVWDDEGDLCGLCIARIAHRPAIFSETERGEIEQLLVRETVRRRGIGRALAEAALRWMGERGIRRAEIQVATENREALAFWRALGFSPAMDVLERRL
jgi:ribosomal protein S18 acetylase RimI-like enzyme